MTRLVQIKLLHNAVWFFFAGCIVVEIYPRRGFLRNSSHPMVGTFNERPGE